MPLAWLQWERVSALQPYGAFQRNHLKEMGSELRHACVSLGLHLELVCEHLLVVAAQPWTPGSTPVHAGTPGTLTEAKVAGPKVLPVLQRGC